MVDNILALPLEMIREVIKYVDYKGLLELRKACRLTMHLSEESCSTINIYHICITSANILRLDMDPTKPPLFLLPYKESIERYLSGEKQILMVRMPIEEFPMIIDCMREVVNPQRPIESFELESRNETCIAYLPSLLEGLRIGIRRIHLDPYDLSEWVSAIDKVRFGAVKTLWMNHEYLYKIIEMVDSITIPTGEVVNDVEFILGMLSKRCSYLDIGWLRITTEEANRLCDELPKLGKKLFFATEVGLHVPERKIKIGSFNIEVTRINNKSARYLSSYLVIRHDDMKQMIKFP